MSNFTAESVNALQQDIVKALKAIEKKYDVTLSVERTTKGQWSHAADFKLTAIASNPYRDNYLKHASAIGAKPEWLDRTFWKFKKPGSVATDDFQVIGLKLPNEIVCDKLSGGKLSGRHYLLSVEQVAEEIARMDARTGAAA